LTNNFILLAFVIDIFYFSFHGDRIKNMLNQQVALE